MEGYFYEPNADDLNWFNFHSAYDNYIGAHFHRSTEILFVREGKMRVVINGVERILQAGDISVANGFDVHYYDGRGESLVYILLFGERYLSDAVFGGKCFENFLPFNEKHRLIFDFLDLCRDSLKDANLLLRQGFIDVVLGLLIKYNGLVESKHGETQTFARVLEYLDEHFNEDLHLESLAADFGYTKNYFSMLFNRYTGRHFREYLNELRIEKMNKLLKENKDITVTYAALTCGFNNLNAYYRTLKKKKS